MSKATLMNNIARTKKVIADITKKISQESKKENFEVLCLNHSH